ncbi:hypothetical protein V6N13_044427 [Hibiscus sabdariffa]|uniref:Uncharacterized protein n=1 Tax=Hibiscus sabdariffa TaxID=183260 RepID=A0ABR2RI64_9ROSI
MLQSTGSWYRSRIFSLGPTLLYTDSMGFLLQDMDPWSVKVLTPTLLLLSHLSFTHRSNHLGFSADGEWGFGDDDGVRQNAYQERKGGFSWRHHYEN